MSNRSPIHIQPLTLDPPSRLTTGEARLIFALLRQTLKDAVSRNATVRRVDAQHGDTLAAFEHMGRPRYPSQLQIQELREASKTGPAESLPVSENSITVKLPPSGLAVIEIH